RAEQPRAGNGHQRDDRRHEQQPDDEAFGGDGRDELTGGDGANLLHHAGAPKVPTSRRSARSFCSVSADSEPSDTMRMNTSSSRGRDSSMRAGAIAIVMRRMA